MKILIVDDEINIQLALKNIIEDLNYKVDSVQNSAEALLFLTREKYSIVFLDVMLGEEDGLELLQKIKGIDQDIQVIMISGESGIKEAVKAIKFGAFDFLEKPLSLPKIKITLNKCVEFVKINSDYRILRKDLEEKYAIIGESDEINKIRKTILKVAASSAKVLIRGESGTGKELVAFAIHYNSKRKNNSFVKFNSAAIPNELVESELFGYEKGAFTGAEKRKKGKIELADSGSLFLDEIGDMSLTAQAKILRVIQEGEFERVGGSVTKKIDCRIIVATHKDLEKMVEEGTFRKDLYYRLNVVPITVPPLRERGEDIKILLNYFSKMYSKELNHKMKIFDESAISELLSWKFSGNVRELKNLIERLYILVDKDIISREDLNSKNEQKSNSNFWLITKTLKDKKDEFEKKYIKTQLELNNNSVTNTAKKLDMHQSNLSRKIKQLNIELS